MKTVKDVMSTLPVWVSETASFREIAARLRECRVSAFPVLAEQGKVTGVVSEADCYQRSCRTSPTKDGHG